MQKELIVKVVYLQRDLLLVQWTNQVRVDVRPLFLNKSLFPVLPNSHRDSKYIQERRGHLCNNTLTSHHITAFIYHADMKCKFEGKADSSGFSVSWFLIKTTVCCYRIKNNLHSHHKNWRPIFLFPECSEPSSQCQFYWYKNAAPVKCVCCLPVEDESNGCHHDDAETQNNHNHILRLQDWKHTQRVVKLCLQ